MTEQPTNPEPSPSRARRDGLVWSKVAAEFEGEPYALPARTRPPGGWPKTGDVGASAQLQADEEPATVPARPYGDEADRSEVTAAVSAGMEERLADECTISAPRGILDAAGTPNLGEAGSSLGVQAPAVDFSKPGFGIVSIEEARSWGITPPPAAELLAMADDLNAHGGLDETFVAGLLSQAADPYAAAKRNLGLVDDPPPVTTDLGAGAAQHLLDTVHEWLGKMPPPPPPIVVPHESRPAFEQAMAQLKASTPPRFQAPAPPGAIDSLLGSPIIYLQPPTRPRPWWRRALDRVRRWTR